MIFTYEELPLENKALLREKLLTLYGRDIAEVNCHFSSRNYAFIFSQGPFPAALRIGPAGHYKSREDVLSELLWVDDLRAAIPTVSQAIPSRENRLVELVQVEGTTYLATLFRKANGDLLPAKYWNPTYFQAVGQLLGSIHRVSAEGYELGFRYKRKHWSQLPYFDFSCYSRFFGPDSAPEKNARHILETICDLPEDPRWFGMIHGDYQPGNLFSDWENVWAFDFDDCCYGYYMFDIACAFHLFLSSGAYSALTPTLSTRERFYGPDGAYLNFRKGYEENWLLPEEQWAQFENFLRLRHAQTLSIMIMEKSYLPEAFDVLIRFGAEYLCEDFSPVDKVDEVREKILANIPADQCRILLKGYGGN